MNTERSLTLAMLIGRWIADADIALDTDINGDIPAATERYTLAWSAMKELDAARLFAVPLMTAVERLGARILHRADLESFTHPDVSASYATLVAEELSS